jgi:hypothetical protein
MFLDLSSNQEIPIKDNNRAELRGPGSLDMTVILGGFGQAVPA